MSFKSTLKGLPECELLRVLYEKAGEKNETDFDCFGVLKEYRKTVAGEVRQINQLFDEYTPHEEEHHLKPLFKLADEMLGQERFEGMECGELFVLAVALYGHDWGMAVSEPEKEYICRGKVRESHSKDDFAVLSDEKKYLRNFARDYYLETDDSGWLKELPPKEIWRDYVRLTHAHRSGEKVRRYFERIDGSVADAACWVCVGHGLDFEQLQNPEIYPVNQSVLGRPANVRALTVYLRLIDLLDLGENRTPYVIWKFVSPKNPRSKMEWAKHRSLRGATFPAHQRGREIRIDGSTVDHEVYAALEDLRDFVEEQLRGCNDTLAQIPDERHTLDLYRVDWQVKARGFEKVSIRFQFDRDRMFEILGEEIYQDDPYVFLRELLQNSIDAIRLRREVLRQRAGVEPKDFGEIRVTVNHGENGDAEIIWSDDGIGMDEHVVKNYLAVGGRSYYRSKEFEAEGIEIDPISRFGIGILSCFMVADQVEIETCKDRNLPPPSEPLRIIIPDMRRQFRVEKRCEDAPRIGTTVKVLVDGRKLPKKEQDECPKPLDVTAYLSVVAGFVEFPIVISEGDRRSIVLHPKQDAEAAHQRFGGGFLVLQLDLGYPWAEVILPLDLAAARKLFREQRYDLSSDLCLPGHEGVISCLVPKGDRIDLTYSGEGGVAGVDRNGGDLSASNVRWTDEWTYVSFHSSARDALSRSARIPPTYAVYRDGILVSGASDPRSMVSGRLNSGPLPRIAVNLPKSEATRVNVARTEIIGEKHPWDRSILRGLMRHLSRTSFQRLLAADPAERWYEFGRLAAFLKVREKDMWDAFPQDGWPLVLLKPEGCLKGAELPDLQGEPVYPCPTPLQEQIHAMCKSSYFSGAKYSGPLLQWAGVPSLVWDSLELGSPLIGGLSRAIHLTMYAVNKLYVRAGVRLLSPPWEGDPPLLQEVWQPRTLFVEAQDVKALLRRAKEDPASLSTPDVSLLYKRWKHHCVLPWAALFAAPFERLFAYGWDVMNLAHPLTQLLLKATAFVVSPKVGTALSSDVLGRLKDALGQLENHMWSLRKGHMLYQRRKFGRHLNRITSCLREIGESPICVTDKQAPSPEDFIPGTLDLTEAHLKGRAGASEKGKTFGVLLTAKRGD